MDASVDEEVTGNQESLTIPRKTTIGPRWKLPISIGLIGVAIVAGLAVAFPKQVGHQIQISLFRQATPNTQLFFTNPAALSRQLRVDEENKISFTVINDQGSSRNYQYTVTVDDAAGKELATRGVFTVKNGGALSRNVLFEPKSHKTKYIVTVELNGLNLSIHYYGATS
jgi:hypothetical protein